MTSTIQNTFIQRGISY